MSYFNGVDVVKDTTLLLLSTPVHVIRAKICLLLFSRTDDQVIYNPALRIALAKANKFYDFDVLKVGRVLRMAGLKQKFANYLNGMDKNVS